MSKYFLLVCLIFGFKSFSAKTLVYCAEGSPSFFNPQLASDGPSFDMSQGLYDRLLSFDLKTGALKPGLALSWSLSKNKLSYTFKLRKKVAFHHTSYFTPSRDFNADDVLFSFERQLKSKHPYHKVGGGAYPYFNSMGLKKLIKSINKVDDYTVRFQLHSPDSTFLSALAMEFSSILSKEYADYLLKNKKPKDLDFLPIGTGPFVFKSYTKDSVLRWQSHKNYFLGAPALNGVVFAIVPDSHVRFQKLKTGECDMMSQPSPLDMQLIQKSAKLDLPGLGQKARPFEKGGAGKALPSAKGNSGYKKLELKLVGGKRYNIAYLAMNVEKGPLKNRKVRRAIHHALNRELYIKAIYHGFAEVAKNPYPSNLWSYNKAIKDYKYSPKKAKELLKQAGSDKGFKLSLWTLPIARPYNPNGKKMGELMQADLAKVGIKVKLKTYDWPTYISRAGKGEHDLIQMGWTSDNGDPDNFLRPLLSSGAVDSGVNLARWRSPTFDNLIMRAIKVWDQKQRALLYKKAQKIFKTEVPWVTLVHTYDYLAMSNKVKGYIQRPFGSKSFYPVYLEKK